MIHVVYFVKSKVSMFSCPDVNELRFEYASPVTLQFKLLLTNASQISGMLPVFFIVIFSPINDGLSFRMIK